MIRTQFVKALQSQVGPEVESEAGLVRCQEHKRIYVSVLMGTMDALGYDACAVSSMVDNVSVAINAALS